PETSQTGLVVEAHWHFEEEGSSHQKDSLVLQDGQFRAKIQHLFTTAGSQSIGVNLNNGLSSLSATLKLNVTEPEPRELHIGLLDDLIDLPSCISSSYNLSEVTGSVIAVFVNTTVPFYISVAVGINLTFSIWFEDTDEIVHKQPCLNGSTTSSQDHTCTGVMQEHVFKECGLFSVVATVKNYLGTLVENVTVVVIEQVMSNLTFALQDGSPKYVKVGDPISFHVSMVTTSRENIYLKVNFADGNVHLASIRDSNSSSMALEGDTKDMFVAASYGAGCVLQIKFDYTYLKEASYVPHIRLFRNQTLTNNTTGGLEAKLDSPLLVLQELMGIHLKADAFCAVHNKTHFILNTFLSTLNLRVVWTITTTNNKVVENVTTLQSHLSYIFKEVGTYIISVTVFNAVSRASVRTSILVQAPIRGLQISCPARFIRTMEDFSCFALVTQGSDVTFTWRFDGKSTHTFVTFSDNLTSSITHTFSQPGHFNLIVKAANQVSETLARLDKTLVVQEPIGQVHFQAEYPTNLGEYTYFRVLCRQGTDVEVEFNFGFGRQTYPIFKDEGYIHTRFNFTSVGFHKVLTHIFNKVSETSKTTEVWIIERLENIHVEIIGAMALDYPASFLVKRNGKILDSIEVHFAWYFDASPPVYTKSPLMSRIFDTTGNHSVNVIITNPVMNISKQSLVNIKDKSEVRLLFFHDTIVMTFQIVTFTLEIQEQDHFPGFSKYTVNFGDGEIEEFAKGTTRWQHQYVRSGLKEVKVVIEDQTGDMLDMLMSYLMVEEPVTGLQLTGPTIIQIDQVTGNTWVAELASGSHVIYVWSLTNVIKDFKTTTPKFEMVVDNPGKYVLFVTAYNDLQLPLSANISFMANTRIRDIEINIIGGLINKTTVIEIKVLGDRDFSVLVDFGDGEVAELWSESNKTNLMLSRSRDLSPLYIMSLPHIYTTTNTFHIRVNVSNYVSYITKMEVFEPIKRVWLTTDSPRVLSIGDQVIVKAFAESGRNLTFVWNFSDNHKPYSKSESNMSEARHSFIMTRDYLVFVTVTNKHYRSGIIATLPFEFQVVDKIQSVSFQHSSKGASLKNDPPNQMTDEVEFKVVAKGSHVHFLFNFGDGTVKEAAGSAMGPFSSDYMPAVVTHKYKAEGIYNISVTASNPLSNMTAYTQFIVQIPPQGLMLFLQGARWLSANEYANKFGDKITFHANITAGTNMTFTWKLGDQSDEVNTGPTITHLYKTAGKKTVFLTAQNEVAALNRSVIIYVEHVIQGADITVEKVVLATGEGTVFRATTFPNYTGNVKWFSWDFGMSPREVLTKSTDVLYKTFQRNGRFIATVTAHNDISNATSPPVEIHVIALVRKLKIQVAKNLLVNQPIQFTEYTFQGSDLNFTWNFGDGSPNITVTNKTVQHVYKSQGEYLVTLLAQNPISSEVTTETLFVLTELYCQRPNVKILGQYNRQVYRSRELLIEAAIHTDCNLTSALVYQWSFFDNQSKTKVMPRNMSEKDLSNRVLILPPRVLLYGNYTVELHVRMKDTIVYAKANAILQVVPSPPVSIIQGGVYRQVNRQGQISLDGRDSMDPDFPDITKLSYQWTCKAKVLRHFSHPCFHDNVSIDMEMAVLTFSSDDLVDMEEFRFELTVLAPDKQNQSSFQVLNIRQVTDVISVQILCPQCDAGLINADQKLTLEAQCDNCPLDSVQYRWTLYEVASADRDHIHYSNRHPQEKCILADHSYLLYSQNSSSDQGSEGRGTTNTPPQQQGTESSRSESNDDDKLNGKSSYQEAPSTSTNEVQGAKIHPWEMMQEGNTVNGRIRDKRSLSSNRSLTAEVQPTIDISVFIPEAVEGLAPSRRVASHPQNNPMSKMDEVSPGVAGSSKRRNFGFRDPVEDIPYGGRDPLKGITSKPNGADAGLDPSKVVNPVRNIPEPEASVLDQHQWEVGIDKDDTKTGLDQESLVIKPSTLDQGKTFIVQLTVSVDDKIRGEAKAYFKVNKSPSLGTCKVQPENGTEMETIFRIGCYEWQDEHKPLQYEVSYKFNQTERKNLIYRGLDHDMSFQLPAGREENDFKVFLYITVLDSLQAKTSVCYVPIQVLPRHTESSRITDLSQIIHSDATSPDGHIASALARGDDRMAKVYISYLASQLNRLDMEPDLDHNNNQSKMEVDLQQNIRQNLLETLTQLPTRDELELLQTAQALSDTTHKPKQLTKSSLDFSVRVLKSILSGTQNLYSHTMTSSDNLVELAVQSASNVVEATARFLQDSNSKPEVQHGLKSVISESVRVIEELVKTELKFQAISEEPVRLATDFFAILASRQSAHSGTEFELDHSKFTLPENLEAILKLNQSEDTFPGSSQCCTPSPGCFQSHMTTFKENPFSYGGSDQVQSQVSSLSLYTCEGTPIQVENLEESLQIRLQIPHSIRYIQVQTIPEQVLRKWQMNMHQFNVSKANLDHSLHLLIELNPIQEGRLFPVSVLISYKTTPSPTNYIFKQDFSSEDTNLTIFMPPGSLSVSGSYYIGIIDSNFNVGRLRLGEITERNYTLRLWWSECLYWNPTLEKWKSDGCWITNTSDFYFTHCRCNHLTAFGSHFELIPNDLSFTDIESFFSPHENMVVITLISLLMLTYVMLMVVCYQADLHDNKKGGIVILQDNTITDKQRYELTVETGFRQASGTSSKISIILHGEEGMSETRELVSDDQRPMFERNSQDKFLLSLPESIGRIYKVQLWHNNFGPNPGWYVSRVTVRDLNTGHMYFFVCERWLAVNEDDGKVEREFTALEPDHLTFGMVIWTKGTQYLADYHIWTSILTRPAYSSFLRIERLTCCLTTLMMYMCLNAVWFKVTTVEYRGEFGLLDLSWRNVTVGTICCSIIIPVEIFIVFLFRRSKPKSASKSKSSDSSEEEQEFLYTSVKPEVTDHSDHVPPIMTYSILDQSILNWPSIQGWAQRQWMKRQQSLMSGSDSNSDNSNIPPQGTNPVLINPRIDATKSELDQASSGFEDASSLLRPQASADSTRTTAAPSVAESMKTHKPSSLNNSDRTNVLCPSSTDSVKTSKAPSVSSCGSQKSAVMMGRKKSSLAYLPYWCRYIAWTLCVTISLACGTITILYVYRFGPQKSVMWLQSLYFSFLVCVFITHPLLIMFLVMYTALKYRGDPTVFDHSDMYNREKAKQDLRRKKNQLENCCEECDELERGVAARQRSRYLRFARPPSEKRLLDARKKILKENRAISLLGDGGRFLLVVILLLVMAYGKDTSSPFYLNEAFKNEFVRSGNPAFQSIKNRLDWYRWSQTSLLDALYFNVLHNKETASEPDKGLNGSSYIIGRVQIRTVKIEFQRLCASLPYAGLLCCTGDYISNETSHSAVLQDPSDCWNDNTIYKHQGVGSRIQLNRSRSEALKQLQELEALDWLDTQTLAVHVEISAYNAPTNLVCSVTMLLEFSPTGGTFPVSRVMSTQLFRYVTGWDNFVLACELLFFLLMLIKLRRELCQVMKQKKDYLFSLCNLPEVMTCIVGISYMAAFVCRFILVHEIVEKLRSTYYEEFVSLSFITTWDLILRSMIAILVFLQLVKSFHLLSFFRPWINFVIVYRKTRRQLLAFLAMFLLLLLAYTSLGRVLFGATAFTFRDLWTSLLGMTALLIGETPFPSVPDQQQHFAQIFIFSFCVFVTGLLTSYMITMLTQQLRSRRGKKVSTLDFTELLHLYWEKYQLWAGLKKLPEVQETENILPPEFTMAEIEYQVDELLFRMNALTGSHGLPEKPPCYFTDSDGTFGAGDDGISSGGSEVAHYPDDRLEHRVQKIEDNLYSQEPYLAQLLKLDNQRDEEISHDKEKQLWSHLELEIFRQLQMQRQEHRPPTVMEEAGGTEVPREDTVMPSSTDTSPVSTGSSNRRSLMLNIPDSPESSHSTGSEGSKLSPIQHLPRKSKTITLLSSISAENPVDSSSSNPDSPKDKHPIIPRLKKLNDAKLIASLDKISKTSVTPGDRSVKSSSQVPIKPGSSASPEAFRLQDKESAGDSRDGTGVKPRPPVKPTFLQATLREVNPSEVSHGKPLTGSGSKFRPSSTPGERLGQRSDNSGSITTESSSGSEQDAVHCARRSMSKRNLRKTKSRGKGKGPDSIAPPTSLDELEDENMEEDLGAPETIPEQG
ncbi:hypothetical protein ACJMK2_023042, partial [Sinanodonta woodiana]